MEKLRLKNFNSNLNIRIKRKGTLHSGDTIDSHNEYDIKFTCFVQLYKSDKYVKVVENITLWNTYKKASIKKIFCEQLYKNISNAVFLHTENNYTFSFHQLNRNEKSQILSKEQIQYIANEYLAR